MADESSNLISIKNLSYSYPDTGKEVLTDINLEIPRGIILGLVGPNGGGKTTLLKIMLGLIKGYSGEVQVRCDYAESGQKVHHTCVGYVPQRSFLNQKFPATVYDTVEMCLYGYTGIRGPNKEERKYIAWLMDQVGITGIKDRPINEISGGQLQRALIARALVTKPAVLFLDEPLVGVDQTGIMQFVELLMQIKKNLNLTVVLVSHDFRAVTMCADRVACLNRYIHYHDNPDHLTVDELTKIYTCSYEAYHGVENDLHRRKDEHNA